MMSLRMVKSKGALYDVEESLRPRAGLFVTPYHPPTKGWLQDNVLGGGPRARYWDLTETEVRGSPPEKN